MWRGSEREGLSHSSVVSLEFPKAEPGLQEAGPRVSVSKDREAVVTTEVAGHL